MKRLIGSLAVGFVGFALVVGVLIATLWLRDTWEDRKHTVLVRSETPIFAGGGNELCGGKQLAIAQPNTTFRVQRIRYWKNCATVDVALPDGRKGHFVLGNGDVSVSPPLP
jgi:hypothetical protein